MGFFHTKDGGREEPTPALREFWRLKAREKDLQDELSLYDLREEVARLENHVQKRREQHREPG